MTGAPRSGRASAAVEELDAGNAQAYLARRGLISAGARIEPLGGGISNVVLRVVSDGDCFVLKQSLPRLRVETVWEFDRRRIFVERDCMTYLGETLPAGSVPEVRFSDDENFVFAMSCAPARGVVWKDALLRNEVDIETAERAAALLAEMQVRAAGDAAVRDRFADRGVLFEGRVEPYHRTASLANPDLQPLIDEEVERMLATRSTLVLGDYSPKNTIVYPDRLLLLDFEVAHFGDPAFDPAFCLNHLVLKAIHFSPGHAPYLAAARAFWRSYRSIVTGGLAAGIDRATARELGCLLLARVDGKSKVEYITDEPTRAFVRELARHVLVEGIGDPSVILEEAEERLRSVGASPGAA